MRQPVAARFGTSQQIGVKIVTAVLRAHLVFFLCLALASLLMAGQASARSRIELPVSAHGARVHVRAERGLQRAADELAAMAEQALRRIETDLIGLPRVASLEVRLVKRQESITLAAPEGSGAPAWAAGTAYPGQGVVVVAARGRTGELLDMQQTLDHELAHMALHRAVGPVPRWLTEGFAFQHAPEYSLARTTTLLSAVLGGALIPIERLDYSFGPHRATTDLIYAESYDFVAYLSQRGRWADKDDDGSRAAFQQFLVELAEKKTPNDAALAAFGRNVGQLEAEWIELLQGRYMWLPVGLLSTLLWVIASVLLVLAWLRRKRQGKRKLLEWTVQEAAADSQAAPGDLL